MSNLKARKRIRKQRAPTVLDVVARARKLITPYSAWTVDEEARQRSSKPCDPGDLRAVRFCAWGALIRAGFDLSNDRETARILARDAMDECFVMGSDSDLFTANDALRRTSAGHRHILSLFDAALQQPMK